MRDSKAHHTSAFTLMELLVVITIIVLLISMLSPALQSAKKETRTTICMTALRQMTIGTDAYIIDNRGFYPPYDNSGGLKYSSFWMTIYDKYHRDDRIRDCPETIEHPVVWGTSKLRWGPAPGSFIGEHTGSYGWNSWLHSGTTNGGHNGYFFRRDNIPHQSKTPMYADSSWVDFWPRSTDGWPPSTILGSQGGQSSMGRVAVDRHFFSVNVGMVDTSVKRIKLPDLWSEVYWHVDYIPLDAPPRP
jgi:hypothetical protein